MKKITTYLIMALLCLILPMGTQSRHKSTKNETILQAKPIIIIDFIHVLFDESKTGFAQKIGISTLAQYTITHWRNPVDVCLKILEKLCEEDVPTSALYFRDYRMPNCIVEWQQGKVTCAQLYETLKNYLHKLEQESYFKSKLERDITDRILSLLLSPQVHEEISYIDPHMLKIIQNLKDKGYTIYGFSNFSQDLYTQLKKNHPSVIGLFDGIMMSCDHQLIKPEKAFFTHLFQTYKLDPTTCILIDKKEHIHVAKEYGIKTIQYKRPRTVRSQLRKLGVI